jgi:Transposase DDE domain
MYIATELFGPIHSAKALLPSSRARLQACAPNELADLFAAHVPASCLRPPKAGPHSRKRQYSLALTFWTFLWQVLNPGSSCREAVRKVMAWLVLLGRPKPSQDNSPYCQARKRLPCGLLNRALEATAQSAHHPWRFHGREVKVADGSTLQAPDTPANQRRFPQLRHQVPGCGLPLIRIVGLFSLASGALLAVAIGNKHSAELKLFRHHLSDLLKETDLLLADRGFCDYVTIAWLKFKRSVDSVLRLQHCRPHDLRQGQRLGKWDRLVRWHKPITRTRTVTARMWRALPQEITLRLIAYPIHVRGFRTRKVFLITTLLDPLTYPAAELAELYMRRWGVELFLRHIKTTLQMELLSGKSPAMLEREILMHFIAYNLIRTIMVQAATLSGHDLPRLSFKGSLDTLRHFSQVFSLAKTHKQKAAVLAVMLSALVNDPVPNRPHRFEPRVRKRRPKPFPLMDQSRPKLKAALARYCP